ncbi:MAG TPA: hypothetical protein VKR32_13155 [Puia sp.]|nr:hypothetical protein [Puia sp.]
MNRLTNLLNILSLVAVIAMPVIGFAGTDDGVEKRKNISKTFNVGSSDKLSIDNSFGDVVINTWDKNEFKVDIEIYAKGRTEEQAQKILDKIDVQDEQSGGIVWFKTNVGHINSKNHEDGDDDDDDGGNSRHRGDKNQEFHINYTVYMPASNPLKIENQFGKTTIPDFKGTADITSKFGELKAGNLDNVDQVDVEFGKGHIGNVHNGKITFKFDSKSVVDKVSGSIKLNIEFSEAEFAISKNIDDLAVNNSYSSVNLVVPKDLSANFEIHTNFGDFKNKTEFNFKDDDGDDDNGPKFDKDINGKAGDGKARIKIKSSFGEVRLSHDYLKESDEDKEKAEKREHREKREKKEKDEDQS